MKLSTREMTLGCATLAVLIVAGTYMWAEPRFETIAAARKQKREHRQIIERSENLLAREDAWRSRLDNLQKKLPRHRPDEQVTAEIMKMLESRARGTNISLLKATPEKEKRVGDLYEMSINYRWEGELTSLVRFLYNLQNESVNLDIRQLSATPSSERSENLKLQGTFTVDVAYTRTAASADRDGIAVTKPDPSE